MTFELEEKVLHFKRPARTSRGAYNTHRMILVTVRDDNGKIVGVGECAPLPDLSYDRNEYDSLPQVRKLIDNALQSGNFREFLRTYPALDFALESALETASYDSPFIRGERGIPINGLVWMSNFDDMLLQVRDKIDAGFTCIKIKIGSIDWDDEIRLISLVRAKYSKKELQIRVDANGAFSEEEVMDKLNQLSKYDIHSIEQPVKSGNWELMSAICEKSPIAVALDEELIGVLNLTDKKKLLDIIHPSYIVIKPTLVGLAGAEEWIYEARKRNIASWVTSALESNVGLRHVATFADRMYGDTSFPQGLGTGLLFTDNIQSDISISGNKLWIIK